MLLSLLSCLTCQTTFAIGISPPEKEILNLKPNSSAEVTFFISRQNPSSEEIYQISIDGTGKDAIHFEDTSIILPLEENNTEINYLIEPVGFAVGDYNATITISPTEISNKSTMSIGLALSQTIHFSVTEEDFSLFSIDNFGVSEDRQHLKINYRIKNDGNTEAKPSKIEITYQDELTPDSVAITEVFSTEDLETADPFSSKDFYLSTKEELQPSLYEITANFYDENNNVLFTRETRFQITKDSSTEFLIFASGAIICITLLLIFNTRKK